jgi:hypothetical protein
MATTRDAAVVLADCLSVVRQIEAFLALRRTPVGRDEDYQSTRLAPSFKLPERLSEVARGANQVVRKVAPYLDAEPLRRLAYESTRWMLIKPADPVALARLLKEAGDVLTAAIEEVKAPPAPETVALARPLPVPARYGNASTLGGLSSLVVFLDRCHEASGSTAHRHGDKMTPELGYSIASCENVIGGAPGYRDFLAYLNIELGKGLTLDALDEVRKRLARRLRQPFDVVDRKTLVEVLEALNRPEPASASGTEALSPSEPPSAGEAPDEQPEAKPNALVILRCPSASPIVRGMEKPRLTDARYNVVKALLDAGDGGLTGDDLVVKSGHGGAVNTLKTLAKSDADWRAVILLAGGPGKRYRLRQTENDGH